MRSGRRMLAPGLACALLAMPAGVALASSNYVGKVTQVVTLGHGAPKTVTFRFNLGVAHNRLVAVGFNAYYVCTLENTISVAPTPNEVGDGARELHALTVSHGHFKGRVTIVRATSDVLTIEGRISGRHATGTLTQSFTRTGSGAQCTTGVLTFKA